MISLAGAKRSSGKALNIVDIEKGLVFPIVLRRSTELLSKVRSNKNFCCVILENAGDFSVVVMPIYNTRGFRFYQKELEILSNIAKDFLIKKNMYISLISFLLCFLTD